LAPDVGAARVVLVPALLKVLVLEGLVVVVVVVGLLTT
jgi:hypothetical protein